ncbi:MAG: hypothetical protein RL330_1077, partial [Actinomycetota bacterium]
AQGGQPSPGLVGVEEVPGVEVTPGHDEEGPTRIAVPGTHPDPHVAGEEFAVPGQETPPEFGATLDLHPGNGSAAPRRPPGADTEKHRCA